MLVLVALVLATTTTTTTTKQQQTTTTRMRFGFVTRFLLLLLRWQHQDRVQLFDLVVLVRVKHRQS